MPSHPLLRHAILLLCISHSPINAFSPLPSVRLAPIKPSCHSKLAPPQHQPTLVTRRRRHHSSSRITRLHLTPSASLSWWYMSLLALQFGFQPILTRKFTPKTITRSTVVLFQEVVKFSAAALFLWASGCWTSSLEGKKACIERLVSASASFLLYSFYSTTPTLTGWTIQSGMLVAGIPAAIYVVQNYCALMAYQNLPPITFNVLNQTKTLSAALCCYFILGRLQSPLQIVSLFLLLLSALVIEKVIPLQRESYINGIDTTTNTTITTNATTAAANDRRTELISGVIPVLMASFLSGLAGALSQKSLQTMGRDSYLFTMELSAASLVFLVASLLLNSPDGALIRERGFFHGWTKQTWIPVITNAMGGIIVGLVTKYAGSVKKGFALIFGLLLSGILQTKEGDSVSREQVVGGILAAISLWMYSNFPITS